LGVLVVAHPAMLQKDLPEEIGKWTQRSPKPSRRWNVIPIVRLSKLVEMRYVPTPGGTDPPIKRVMIPMNNAAPTFVDFAVARGR
jgi:hypothetical protein